MRRPRSAGSSASSRSRRTRTLGAGRRVAPESPDSRAVRGGRLRRATERDLATLVRHRRAMFTEIGWGNARELDRHDAAYRRWARRRLRSREFLAYVVEAPDGRVAGSGALWLQPQQPRPGRLGVPALPYVMSMYTEPSFRGQGVATRLVEAMVRWASTHGYPRIFLHASTMGRAVYARAGFQDGNEMRLDLAARRARRS